MVVMMMSMLVRLKVDMEHADEDGDNVLGSGDASFPPFFFFDIPPHLPIHPWPASFHSHVYLTLSLMPSLSYPSPLLPPVVFAPLP